MSGTQGRFGYYLTGGKLRSDGLLPNNMVDQDNFYGKLNYDLPLGGSLGLTTGLTEGASGQLAFFPNNYNQDTRDLFSTLSVRYPLTDSLSIDASLTARRSRVETPVRGQADNSLLDNVLSEEAESGASLKVSWLDELQRITAGVDYHHISSHLAGARITPDLFERSADRVGIYLNDTITLGDFALTPSARLDHTEGGGRQFSPSFGVTYALTENSVLRGYTAKGYSITSLNLLNSTEKVWTSQVGFESADIPYLWIKGTLFRNDTWNVDVRVGNPDGTVSSTKQSQLKQGYELEGSTPPLLGTSFSAGYTFIHATGDSGAVIKGAPRHTLALGVKFEDSRYLRAFLTGHYIDWNEEGGNKYHDVVWDLHLGKTIDYSDNRKVELFLSVRNLLNSGEFSYPYANVKRWGEVGVRCAF